MGMVRITHPDIDAIGEATEEAFNIVWEPRGWVRVDQPVVAANDTLGVNVTSLEQLNKQQLVELGRQSGIEVNMRMAKEDLVAALNDIQLAAEPQPE
jgi:hypothetical protein